ncbi:hypothetical protein IMCC14465_10080 [alpha proteobacterium IMCC14465]|uniref:SnoaL-like domain-containing protein n=1 Tax=alpha proteobacterium IMCC14465 TaxID=1220535 RepID=J9DW25_9PROT|nr:hypothetical protein IMCC14465_10080 [alpha proteobacterium IMCC14465]
MDNRDIVKSFYGSISGGDAETLEKLLDENFELIVPTAGGVLSGRYIGKARFLADIIGTVFGCVTPEDIVFCKNVEIICAEGDKVVAIAQNDGVASSGKTYNQVYAHILTVQNGKLTQLIEFFDTHLANQALWKPGMDEVTPDEVFSFTQLR